MVAKPITASSSAPASSSASAARGSSSSAQAPGSSSSSSSRRTKGKRKKKGQRRRSKDSSDYRGKAPAGTGPKLSLATQRAYANLVKFEARTLTVGSLARNICSRLLANYDRTEYPFKSPEFFDFFREQRRIAEAIAAHIRTCVETAQLLQKTVYEILMLAIDDIKNPERLKKQSREQRTRPQGTESESESMLMSVSSSLPGHDSDHDMSFSVLSTGPQSPGSDSIPDDDDDDIPERQPWQLPEVYDADFIHKVIEQSVIYALPTLVFYGQNRQSTDDDDNLAVADSQNKSTRGFKDRRRDYSKFYVHWIFQRYQNETGFVPFHQRGIHVLRAEASRSALASVIQAVGNHYKYAVVSLTRLILKYFGPKISFTNLHFLYRTSTLAIVPG